MITEKHELNLDRFDGEWKTELIGFIEEHSSFRISKGKQFTHIVISLSCDRKLSIAQISYLGPNKYILSDIHGTDVLPLFRFGRIVLSRIEGEFLIEFQNSMFKFLGAFSITKKEITESWLVD